jgi:hypothetical protein
MRSAPDKARTRVGREKVWRPLDGLIQANHHQLKKKQKPQVAA